MKLTLDLLNRCWHAPTKAQESRAGGCQKGARHGSHPFGSLATQAARSDNQEAETLLDLQKQYIRLYYACIAKRLGVDASYINRVANGEHQSERLRRALLSELVLVQAVA